MVIGRNEGARLLACLDSVAPQVAQVVYVDSGSADASAQAARARGAKVVALDMTRPFSAARARNEGAARLDPAPEFILFLDGDTVVDPQFVTQARALLDDRPDLAVVCGRRRERFPGASVYNRLIDLEWDTPVGEAQACGGDALMRGAAFRAVGGFDPTVIAGEEPELCLRLRAAGWRIWRIDAEMTLHDAGLTRFGQWWTRARRAGYAYALGAHMHGATPERHWVRETRRALLWGLALPGTILFAAVLVSPWALAALLAYPVQILRLGLRSGDPVQAGFLTLAKFAEAQGILGFRADRQRGRSGRIIEYK